MTAKRKKSTAKFKFPSYTELKSNEKVFISLGVVLLCVCLYLAVAFASYFFTGSSDQSLLDGRSFFSLGEISREVKNWAGAWGAYFAEMFIFRYFGISSFVIVYFFGIVALRLLRLRIIPVWKAFVLSACTLIWLSVFLKFAFPNVYLGGIYGEEMNLWLDANVGFLGTLLILILSLFIFCLFSFKSTLPFLKKLFTGNASSNSPERGEQTPIVRKLSTDYDDDIAPVIINGHSSPNPSKEGEFSPPGGVKGAAGFEIIIPTEEAPLNPSEGGKQSGASSPSPSEEAEESYDASELGEYDPTLDLSNYHYPTFGLLKDYGKATAQINYEEQHANQNKIRTTLGHYGIEIESITATVGPTITLYEIVPKAGVRISKIKNLESDIMLSLAAIGIRIIAPIPGKGTIGIEVPNSEPQIVSMQSILASKKFQESKFDLPIAFGRTITNDIFMVDLCKMPHLLVAGATGQGKSVGLNAAITSLLYKKHPSLLKFVLIDPKKVEFNIYADIEKHFLAKLPDGEDAIITDVTKVVQTLNSLTKEMDDRYDLLKKAHVRNLKEYNDKFINRRLNPEKGHRFMPYIVVIIDEFGDLIMQAGKEVELPIARIAQLARAVGIHMIIATQRPSVNIITGVIKANFPARVAFRVSSQIDSRTILDTTGANQLIGRGDMLFSQGGDLIRVQCAFVDTPEVENVAKYIQSQQAYPTAFYLPEYVGTEGESNLGDVDLSKKDPMFEEAARLIVASQQGSTSLIQRKFSIGYNRAGRIVDQLEAAGIIGPFEGSKARQVLVQTEYELERILRGL